MVVVWGSQPPVGVNFVGDGDGVDGLGKKGRRREYGNGWMEGDFRRKKEKGN